MSQTLIHDPGTAVDTAAGSRGAPGTSSVPAPPPAPAHGGAPRRDAPRRGGLRRHPHALIALIAAGALLVGLLGGFGLGRATAPDPFARLVEMRSGAPADGSSLPSTPPGAIGPTAPSTGPSTVPDPTTALDAGRTGAAVYLTAGLVSATNDRTSELFTA